MTERMIQTVPRVGAIAARIPTVAGGVRPTRRQVAEAVAFIAREFRPERIVLFGSRAYGTPRADSDADLMVIMETPLTSSEQARAIRRTLQYRPMSSIDVHVRTPEQITVGLREGDFFLEDVMLQGLTVYERERMDASGNDQGSHRGKDIGAWPNLKESTRDWLRKADGNADSASQLLVAERPNFDDICFLAQQCVEKTLKALLQERDVLFPRTHDIEALVALAMPFLPAFDIDDERFRELSQCAVEARYPSVDIDQAGAERAVQTMARMQGLVRRALAQPTTATQPDPGSP